MQTTEEDNRFTIRLADAADDLEYGAGLAGENRSAFIRTAIRQRVERLERETTTEGEPHE